MFSINKKLCLLTSARKKNLQVFLRFIKEEVDSFFHDDGVKEDIWC